MQLERPGLRPCPPPPDARVQVNHKAQVVAVAAGGHYLKPAVEAAPCAGGNPGGSSNGGSPSLMDLLGM